nr:MAG TPA: hypothetical protein [Caudoviricetes sp.]
MLNLLTSGTAGYAGFQACGEVVRRKLNLWFNFCKPQKSRKQNIHISYKI